MVQPRRRTTHISGVPTGRSSELLSSVATWRWVRRVRALASAPRSADGIMLALGAVVGLGTGLLAVAMIELIEAVQLLAFGRSAGSIRMVAATTLGGLAVGLLLTYWLPEARGGGVTHLMESLALHGGRMRAGLPFGKLVATGLSLGTGASGGREGPMVQVGGSFGSALGRAFALNEEQKRALIAGGAAAGIAAAFNAPVGGMLFAVEVIIGGFRQRYLQVVVIASVVASVTARQIVGDALIYNPPPYSLGDPAELGFYVLVGLAAVAVGLLFIHGEAVFSRFISGIPLWPPLRTAAAGLLMGVVALGLPEILGTGDNLPSVPGLSTQHPIAEMLDGVLGRGGWYGVGFLLLLTAAKLTMTLVCIGSGYSVGSLGPSIFIGAALGGSIGHLATLVLPPGTIRPGALALAGMAAVLAVVDRAPLTAVLIVFELTGDYDMVVPLMLAVGIATLIGDRLIDHSVYTLPLLRRGVVYGEPEDIDIMQTVRVGEIMTTNPATVPEDLPLPELERLFRRTGHHGFPVVSDGDRLVGIVTLADLRSALGDVNDDTGELTAAVRRLRTLTAGDICTRRVLTVTPEDPMFRALRRMASIDVGRLPVVAEEDHGRLVGLVRRADVVKAYQRAVARSVGVQHRSASSQLRDLTGTRLIEVVVDASAEAAGKAVRDVEWPPRTVLTGIRRRGDVLLPNGATVLQAGDDVVVLTAEDHVETVRSLLAGAAETPGTAARGKPSGP